MTILKLDLLLDKSQEFQRRILTVSHTPHCPILIVSVDVILMESCLYTLVMIKGIAELEKKDNEAF